jgi:hypothetical protein
MTILSLFLAVKQPNEFVKIPNDNVRFKLRRH